MGTPILSHFYPFEKGCLPFHKFFWGEGGYLPSYEDIPHFKVQYLLSSDMPREWGKGCTFAVKGNCTSFLVKETLCFPLLSLLTLCPSFMELCFSQWKFHIHFSAIEAGLSFSPNGLVVWVILPPPCIDWRCQTWLKCNLFKMFISCFSSFGSSRQLTI